ncbi:glycosyltransferase [Candidatus Margulisiibacteriota bacterium]
MKILFITEVYLPYLSGVTVSLATFVKYLARQEHEIAIIAPGYPQRQYKNVNVEDAVRDGGGNITILRLPSFPSFRYPGFRVALPMKRKMWKFIKEFKPDVIHSQAPFTLGRIGAKFAKKLNVPLFYTFHTMFHDYVHFIPLIPGFVTVPLMIRYVRNFCHKCSRVVVPTPIVEDVVHTTYNIKTPLVVIPTGVDDDAISTIDRQRIRKGLNLDPADKVLLYCGRLSKEKNIEFLIDAMVPLLEKRPDMRLMIVAGGPLLEFYKKYAIKKKVEKNVIFTGQVTRDVVYDYIAAGDLFVSASKTETQGLVLMEAKAIGIPAIGIAEGGTINMIEDGVDGFLVQDNINQFTEKVLEVVNDDELLQKLKEGAIEQTHKKFLASVTAQKLVDSYNSVLS